METYKYTCNYCQKEYIPTKRGKQKYCKAGCRQRASQIRQKKKKDLIKVPDLAHNDKVKIDKMSTSGVGNATAGTLLADGLKAVFTKEENKPATKGDLGVLYDKIGRFHRITNLPPNESGALPYFDLHVNEVKYFLLSPR